MAKYRLLSKHYLPDDKLLDGDAELGDGNGTVVGDGTPHRVDWPTLEMVALDEEAEEMIEKERERIRIDQATMTPVDDLPDLYEENYLPGSQKRRKAAAAHGATVTRVSA